MQQLLVIPTDRKHIGWPIASLSEITASPPAQPLPAPYPHLAGTTFHRGRILTLVDLGSVIGSTMPEGGTKLAVRLAAPHDHLAVLVPGVDAVLTYSPLELREEGAGGLWAGLYPWEEAWISVINPNAVVQVLTAQMSEYLHSSSAGRSHVP